MGADGARPRRQRSVLITRLPPTVPGVNRQFDRLLLVRHGETKWNRAGRRQGQLDSDLTAKGRRDAVSVGDALVGRHVSAIFSSPLGRARQTAGIVATRIGTSVQVIDDLAEVHHGAMAGLTDVEIEERFPGELRRRAADKFDWPFPEGESYAHAMARAEAALAQVAATGAPSPLLVTHEMIGRMLLRSLFGLSVEEALSLTLPHRVVIDARPRAGSMTIVDGRAT